MRKKPGGEAFWGSSKLPRRGWDQGLVDFNKSVLAEDGLEVYENQLEIVVKATYSLHRNKYFEIFSLTFWGRSLVARRFGVHPNSQGADEIKDLLISIDFRNRNTELLLLLSITSPWLIIACLNKVFCEVEN